MMYIKSSKYRDNSSMLGIPVNDFGFFKNSTNSYFGKVTIWKSDDELDKLFTKLAKNN